MNADAFRQLYDYHFSENRKLWDSCIMALSQKQFTQPVGYSRGSVRDQVVHLMDVDEAWFSDVRGAKPDDLADFRGIDNRQVLRERWDKIEQDMGEYLAALRDEMLFEKPIAEGEDKDLILWQILIHVVNHGTDHRAQILRLLSDLGFKTGPQDYIFYVYDHLQV